MMRFYFLIIFSSLTLSYYSQQSDSLILRKVFDYYLTQSKCYSNLEFLSTKIESRLSGSAGAAKAVFWAKKAMYEAGADTVVAGSAAFNGGPQYYRENIQALRAMAR